MVTTRPMKNGTALSDRATNNSMTNSAANSHFAWRAKCHRKAISPPGGSGFSGAAVGLIALLLYLFLRTNLGTAMRAAGDKPGQEWPPSVHDTTLRLKKLVSFSPK